MKRPAFTRLLRHARVDEVHQLKAEAENVAAIQTAEGLSSPAPLVVVETDQALTTKGGGA